jgi:hypothetical protein
LIRLALHAAFEKAKLAFWGVVRSIFLVLVILFLVVACPVQWVFGKVFPDEEAGPHVPDCGCERCLVERGGTFS